MAKPKTLDQLRAEKERAETQLAQEQQMAWVQQMNNIRHSAEESVLSDLIYA